MKIFTTVRTHRYELIALSTSACVMMLEIVGARLVSPYFGASLYIWTAMIGVILGALSVGFWYGGRLADRYEPHRTLTIIITSSAVSVLIMAFIQSSVLSYIASQRLDLRLSAILAALLLFSIPSLLIGMVSPHLAKIRLTSLESSGETMGRLEAAGALGSIAGTFLCGYWLLAYFGARSIVIVLAVTLLATSFLASMRWKPWPRLAVLLLALPLLLFQSLPAAVLADVDTAYSRYRIVESERKSRAVRYLVMDSYSTQSGQYVGSPTEPVFAYIEKMQLTAGIHPNPERILIIGGGVFTLPMILADDFPSAQIDIVEIDPVLGTLSEQFFDYKSNPNITAYFEDGRSFINRDNEQYDLIFVDAYSSLTPPFHLSSLEAASRLNKNLKPDGMVVSNIVDESSGDFLASMNKTYEQIFSNTKVFRADVTRSTNQRQNFLLIGTNDNELAQNLTTRLEGSATASAKGLILSDNYAPVERMSY